MIFILCKNIILCIVSHQCVYVYLQCTCAYYIYIHYHVLLDYNEYNTPRHWKAILQFLASIPILRVCKALKAQLSPHLTVNQLGATSLQEYQRTKKVMKRTDRSVEKAPKTVCFLGWESLACCEGSSGWSCLGYCQNRPDSLSQCHEVSCLKLLQAPNQRVKW